MFVSCPQVNAPRALIQRGAPTHQEDYEGLRPLDLAKENQHDECVQLLFKNVNPTILVRRARLAYNELHYNI